MDRLIAVLLDSFKAKSPKVWAILAFLLTVIQYSAEQGSELNVFHLEGVAVEVLKWVTWAIGLLMGSRTYVALNADKIAERDDKVATLETQNVYLRERFEALMSAEKPSEPMPPAAKTPKRKDNGTTRD